MTGDLLFHLGRAQGALQVAQRLLPTPEQEGLRVGGGITAAVRTLAAIRDTIESHRGPDRTPLTPYALAFSTQPALDYMAHRTAELAWQAGRITLRLSLGIDDPGVLAGYEDARRFLDQASVLGRADTWAADMSLAALPLVLPVEPVQATPADPTHLITARLADDCERLSRAAFETMNGRTDHTLSGSDLQQLSRWTAMNRLLAGRVLLHVADHQTSEPATRSLMREAAGDLRKAAQTWQQAAAAWHRIVDVADPRAHPSLPPPSYEIVRRGEVVRLPQVVPHPATVIAHTSVIRVGQLLYGAQWRPEGGKPGEARPVEAVLADAQGAGALASTLYRLPATGWQVAVAAPVAIRRIQGGLVTDSIEHRPDRLDARMRFYPVHDRQLAAMAEAYRNVTGAEQAAAVTLLGVAQQIGTPVPRAALDATAHRMIAAHQGWSATVTARTATPQAARPSAAPLSRSAVGPSALAPQHTAPVRQQGQSR
ncbi:hypothetical protein [Streptomyces marianii]|uniref:Uncharacterized protein n=1 Tax=Streptomyces marianii TaxID=1817406 RepID=A0A5R9DW01_9ACTN|nr:hypothetical protein [Streptomyces marianii]TLQ38941.1 hypothetical protein FEF34_39660 [Streptomyces marianii]